MILLNIFESCNGRTPWELLLWLLGAFILGYLLRMFLDRNKNTLSQGQTTNNAYTSTSNGAIKSEAKTTENLAVSSSFGNMNPGQSNKPAPSPVVVPPVTSMPPTPTPVTPSVPPVSPAGQPSKPLKDDLTKIEGIGPKINQLLNDAGIYTFLDLEAAHFDTLKQILHNAGERFRMHDPTTWPRQSGLAAKGLWEELKTLQDHLKGGREE